MTVKELSQIYYLKREIADCKKKLKELELQRDGSSVIIDDMPHGKGPAKSKVEQLAADIVDIKAIIHAKQIECIHERSRVERFIAGIPDSLTRLIFSARFVDCLSWDDVADFVGGSNTGDSVRMRCYRYMNALEGDEEQKPVTECSP